MGKYSFEKELKEDITKLFDKAKEEGIISIDFRFTDMLGSWQHFTTPLNVLKQDIFEEGLGFDGSSIKGWQSIHESDLLMMPDYTTVFKDPFTANKTLVYICDIRNPNGNSYLRDPRTIAKKADTYLKDLGIADTAFFGPEAEFFVFDGITFSEGVNHSNYSIDSIEGDWNSSKDGNVIKIPRKGGYFPVSGDLLNDIRDEMMHTMIECGIEMEKHHHEVATGGQCEINLKFSPLMEMADTIMLYKDIIKKVSQKNGKIACFMPKPLFGDNGSGMHIHFSLFKNDRNLFAGNGYARLSDLGLYAIGGILKHAKALTAITNPTTNSYKRLVPGFEAPVNLAYSQRNRSASIRIPTYSKSEKAIRAEVRFPDPMANPYLAFTALLMAALDGIQNKTHPGNPIDKNIYELPAEEKKLVQTTPGSLEEALNALEQDHEFLLKGNVFTKDFITNWIEYKRTNEVDPVRIRPHPHEFRLYIE